MTRLGIITALPAEQRTLSKQRIALGGWTQLTSNTLLSLSGAGPERAAIAGRMLIDKGASALLSWGCAAGLDKALTPGSLILPAKLIAADGHVLDTDPIWHQHLNECLSERFIVHTGSLIESRQLVLRANEKATLSARLQGIALDMESAALARVARERRVPFVVIRAIADPAHTDLPRSIAHALDNRGDINLVRLLTHTLLHPSELIELIHVGRHFHAAQQTLRRVAQQAGFSFLAPLPHDQQPNRTAA